MTQNDQKRSKSVESRVGDIKEVRKVDNKEFYEKTEEFAKKIVSMAKENGLTVRELYAAADTAKGIADNSMVDIESIEKTDFPSRHIAVPTASMLDVSGE